MQQTRRWLRLNWTLSRVSPLRLKSKSFCQPFIMFLALHHYNKWNKMGRAARYTRFQVLGSDSPCRLTAYYNDIYIFTSEHEQISTYISSTVYRWFNVNYSASASVWDVSDTNLSAHCCKPLCWRKTRTHCLHRLLKSKTHRTLWFFDSLKCWIANSSF